MKIFVHKFNDRLCCTYHVPDQWWGEKWVKAKPFITWQGIRAGSFLEYREYVTWINTVNQQLSDEWNKRLMHCFKSGPALEIWCYEPGISPA
jgi:hypothetical protein